VCSYAHGPIAAEHLACPLDYAGEQVLHRCAVAAARIGQPGSTRTPAQHVAFSAMTAAILYAVTRVQICAGAGMVSTAAGGLCAATHGGCEQAVRSALKAGP